MTAMSFSRGWGTTMSRVAIAGAIACIVLGCEDPVREYEKRYAARRKAVREWSTRNRQESKLRFAAMAVERAIADSLARMRPDPACGRAVVAVRSRCLQFMVEKVGY